MPVYRVTISAAADPGVTCAGDFIAESMTAASRLAAIMANYPPIKHLFDEGYVVDVENSATDPRVAANYEGPPIAVAPGGTC